MGFSNRAARSAARMWLAAAAAVHCLAAGLLCLGCNRSDNPKTYPVSGKITYRGKPVTSGMVLLTPVESGHAATGSLDASGGFRLTTFERDDGAVPGTYQVAVQAFPAEGAGLPGAEFAGKSPPIPQKYMSGTSSGLTAEIKNGENHLEFPLKD